jgi:hypothetical protein
MLDRALSFAARRNPESVLACEGRDMRYLVVLAPRNLAAALPRLADEARRSTGLLMREVSERGFISILLLVAGLSPA